MSETAGDDVPRDPWGNPLGPEDRAPEYPKPDDYPPTFPADSPAPREPSRPAWPPSAPQSPPEAPRPDPGHNPAWPGRQEPTSAPPPANPAWPGSRPTRPAPGGPPGPYGAPPPGDPYGAPPQGWAPQGAWAPPRTEGMAIGAFVCALVGLLCMGIILEPVAVVLGVVARRRIRESNGALKGDGLALAAIVVGIVGFVLAIVGMVILLANPDALDDLLNRFTTTTTGG